MYSATCIRLTSGHPSRSIIREGIKSPSVLVAVLMRCGAFAVRPVATVDRLTRRFPAAATAFFDLGLYWFALLLSVLRWSENNGCAVYSQKRFR